jgi:hypothetical protein
MMKMLEGQQINSYRLNKFIGAGGFGGVFHASEIVRNTSVQEVAIKVIPGSSLLGMVRSGGRNRLNPYLARDLID